MSTVNNTNIMEFNRIGDNCKDTLSKLKFISRVAYDEKINVRDMSVHQNGYFTAFYRMFWEHDSRGNTLSFVHAVLNRSFELISMYINSSNPYEKTMCTNLIEGVLEAREGLSNIQKTYFNDSMFVCQIETLAQDVQGRLYSLKESYPDIFLSIEGDIDSFKLDGKKYI